MIQKDNSISSKIIISCKRDGDKTLLGNGHFDIPYKVVHYGSKLLQKHLEMMMMCYSPGVMDGDRLDIEVTCPADTEMKLFTQSFNKLHPMKKGASQQMAVRLKDNALFQFLPQPTIPFKNSIFKTSNEIYLEGDSHLIWGDIISGGRIYSGEKFEFNSLHSITKIYHNKKLIFFDNQLMQPKKQPLQDLLFFEGHTHQGTLLLVSSYAMALKQELDALLLEQFTDMSYGFTQCAPNVLMVRALGESGDAMHEWLGNIGSMCWSYIQFHQNLKKESALPPTAISKSAKKAKPPAKRASVSTKKVPVKKKSTAKAKAKK